MYKHMTKILLVFVLGLMVTNCSTYKMKSDFNGKNGVVNKVPKWYVKYPHTTKKKYQEAATAVSPDLELAVKSYRVYVMVEISKDHIATIISEINAKKVAQLNTSDIDAAAKKVLNN